MAAPIWKTPKGNLGTIQEQEFYELDLKVIVPDDTDPSLQFKIIAGSLPPGIILNETTGSLNGRPKDAYRFRGVPFDVSEDTTNTFCCRVINTKTKQVSDRTFSLTVTGQDAPTIVSTTKELGKIYDGTYASFQITAIDLDREALTYKITKGVLPPGLTLDKNTGIISGLVSPSGILELGSLAGWSAETGWDDNLWDFNVRAISKRFEFDVSVTDNKDIVTKTFNIYVISKDSITADNTSLAVNGYYDMITADADNRRNPVLTTPSSDIGTYAHDNYFSYKFTAVDFDGDALSYTLLVETNVGYDNETNGFDSTLLDMGDFELPPGLTLSEETGWLYGKIPSLQSVQKEYEFGVFVYKRNDPLYRSKTTRFKITLVGDLKFTVKWLSPDHLGTVTAGEISELSVAASNALGKQLVYSLQLGSNSRLPQGLRLLNNGLIAGRASFEVTSFDQNTVTFDKRVREVGAILPETTIDKEYSFTVKANDLDNSIVAYKTFKIKIVSEYNRPYESLYLRAHPGIEDKELFNQVVFNSDIIPNEFVYRSGDPFFGKRRTFDLLVLSGINPSVAHKYIEAMVVNHYRKKLLIGEPEIAQALDKDGNVKYEVLYLPIKDDLGSTLKSIDLRSKIKKNLTIDQLHPSIDQTIYHINELGRVVYPNSLVAMRNQIKTELGFVDREVLPTWMRSKQKNGVILYWTPSVVLAYLKPGTGDQVKFLFNRLFTQDLKLVSFEVDRYIWDCNLSTVYDSTTNSYVDSSLTSFDLDILQNLDELEFRINADGIAKTFDTGTKIEPGIVNVVVSRYVTLSDNSLKLVEDKKTLNVDFTVSNRSVIFINAPPNGAVVSIKFSSGQVVTADYAVTIPFNKLDGVTSNYITEVFGGFDSSVTVYEGKRIVFAVQENYPGYIGPSDGWIQNNVTWDDGGQWDDPNIGWDDYRYIPGYNENQANSTVVNERAGIWEVQISDTGLTRLEFIEPINLGQRVKVVNGSRFGGKVIKYGPTIKFHLGETVPSYTIVGDTTNTKETIFDGGSTRFVESISVYQVPDEGDKYLAFPRVNIFA